ncbi:MAG TPA: hypothetical protein VGG36_02020 [Rhizomicrobium sp.]|jgi:hypothetical protein
MADKQKKPDLRDKMWEPKTTIDTPDRKFAEQPIPDESDPHIVSPDVDVHVPGQTTKQ